MIKRVTSLLLSLASAGILLLHGTACTPLQPEHCGSLAVSLSSAGGSSAPKSAQAVRLSRLRCILTDSGVKVFDNVFYEHNGYFTVVIRDLLPGTAYHLALYGGVSSSCMDAVAERDSIIIEPDVTTSIEMVLHSLIPVPAEPENGASFSGPDVTFTWKGCEFVNNYLLFVATDEEFSRPFLIQPDILTTHYTLHGCAAPATLYWKVSAKHEFGGYSSWSEARYVTID
ncbi:hypothetical protein JXO52_08030 [bacterium]|nr:hypothetical protein [bacterium]